MSYGRVIVPSTELYCQLWWALIRDDSKGEAAPAVAHADAFHELAYRPVTEAQTMQQVD